jgi:hypothetical protein
MPDDGFHTAEMRIIGFGLRKDGVTSRRPGRRVMEWRTDLYLPRYRQVAIETRAILYLLHGQGYPELPSRGVGISEDGHRQKHFVVVEPVARTDDEPTQLPARVVKEQIAYRAEMAIESQDGIAFHHGCVPQHCVLLCVHVPSPSKRMMQ